MTRAQQYYFSDFTLENYKRLISLAKKNYVFRTYNNFIENERFIIWRHDIDASVHAAYKLAEIENNEQVSSTFFLHIHSEFYNLFEKEIYYIISNIINIGHEIGLHFDSHFYNVKTEEQLEHYIRFEKNILENIFNVNIKCFSFHNPGSFELGCSKWKYGDLINTYADYFQKEVGYCSDSNGYWRHRRLEDVLNSASDERLQVLTHPACWQPTVMSPKQRVWKCIDGRATACKKNYSALLSGFGRENIDW